MAIIIAVHIIIAIAAPLARPAAAERLEYREVEPRGVGSTQPSRLTARPASVHFAEATPLPLSTSNRRSPRTASPGSAS